MKNTVIRIVDRHLAVDRRLDTKREIDDFAKFIINDMDKEILDIYVKPVLEKINKSYSITPICLETIDDPSYDTVEVRKSVDITLITKCKDCRFLETKKYMEEAGIWRMECRCELDHLPRDIYSFFCADGLPREED